MIRKRAGTDILFSNVQHLKTATFDQMGTLMEQNLCLMGSFTVISAPKIPSPAHAYIPADYVGNFHFGIPPSQPPTDFPLFLPSSLNAHSKGIDFILTRLVIPPHSTHLLFCYLIWGRTLKTESNFEIHQLWQGWMIERVKAINPIGLLFWR